MKRRCVYGCSGRAVDLVAVAVLDDLAAEHHGHAVADVADDGEVVRDEQVGDAGALLDLDEQIQHTLLGRQVQCRHGLVADDELRIEREGARDRDALTLPAREFARQTAARVRRQPDLVEQLPHAGLAPCVDATPRAWSGSARICSIVSDGFSDE